MANPWSAVDDWRVGQEGLRRNARRQLSACTDSVWHARMRARAWLYRTKAGEDREWLQHQLAHAHNWSRVSIFGLCSEELGPVPAIQGNVAHRLTTIFTQVTCKACRVLLDREMELGRLSFDPETMRFSRKASNG